MRDLPTGTVTFLFTDVEGSTRLLRQFGDRYVEIQADHRRLLRAAFAAWGGRELETQGDGFLVAFARASDAVASVIAAQRALAAHTWPDAATVRVRMGVHTGEPQSIDAGYVGLDLHRAARICTAGHGGQILISEATRVLAEVDLPEGVELRDLGAHRLKDLAKPERLFQVVAPDLSADFPPLRSLDTVPNNLPRQLTSFIGRASEVAKVGELIRASPLLTLTGAGGVGKTRLAIQTASDLLGEYHDGVWLIELASLGDPERVPHAAASALNLRERPGRSAMEMLVDYLGPKQSIIVLDNCEHLLPAAAALADELLHACQALRVLATSREGLGVVGEALYPVPSLSVPDPQRLPSVAELSRSDGVRLFTERATAVLPTFALTERNGKTVVEICRRLDGIPLAIELAATRVKAMSVEQIAARLDDRFRLLTGGGRTALPRHQTLQAALDWGHQLLSDGERILFRRLAVFAGGFTLEAVEKVGAGDGVAAEDVLGLLTHLVERSLVAFDAPEGEARYRLLETVRQYALAKLLESDETDAVRAAHLEYYLAFAEQAEPQLRGPGQTAWLARLATEHENLRAALGWSLARPEGAEAGLRLAGALQRFWFMRGPVAEGREWLKRAVSSTTGATTGARARALVGLGMLAWRLDDYPQARGALEESLALSKAVGDESTTAFALHHMAHVMQPLGEFSQAVEMFEESVSRFRKAGEKWGIAWSLRCLGDCLRGQGATAQAVGRLEESLAAFREVGDKYVIGHALTSLGAIAAERGDYERANALFEESLAIWREAGDNWGTAGTQRQLGNVALLQGHHAQAAALFKESIRLHREHGDKHSTSRVLEALARLALAHGRSEQAARLLGAADGLLQAIGAVLAPVERVDYDRTVAMAREVLGDQRFDVAYAEGRTLSLDQLIEQALSEVPSRRRPTAREP